MEVLRADFRSFENFGSLGRATVCVADSVPAWTLLGSSINPKPDEMAHPMTGSGGA
jgi:hypothetical protein